MASFALISFVFFWSKPSSSPRWCTAAANVDRLQQINIIEFCVWGPPRKIQTTLSTSLRMRGGEISFMDGESCFFSLTLDSLWWQPSLLSRSMHYPPETSSIMLMARMVAVVKQVRHLWRNWLQFSSDPIGSCSGITVDAPMVLKKIWADHIVVMQCFCWMLVMHAIKAKDKDQWQKLFSHFCSRAANEEEEIAHKLLGEQFRVSLQSGHVCVNCVHVNVSKSWHCCAIWVKLFFPLCRYHHFLFHPGAAGLVTQPFQSSTLWWRSQSGKRKAAASKN